MAPFSFTNFLIMLLALFLQLVSGSGLDNMDRSSAKVYVKVKGFTHCFRRFNGTSQIGCSSDFRGNVGVLHLIENQDDLDWLLKHGANPPYIVLLNKDTFNRDFVEQVRMSNMVNGILVIQTSDDDLPLSGFSPDKSCPNDGYDLYQNNCAGKSWHNGNGMAFESYDFPIMLLTNGKEVSALINDCYVKYNKPINGTERDYPLCSVQMKTVMAGAKDTPTCLRRSNLISTLEFSPFCDYLSNSNVHLMTKVHLKNETRENSSIIMVAARIDTFSMFDKLYPSADSSVSGIVTLLATIQALSAPSVKQHLLEASKTILFSMFHGEAFDYIGSSRVVYDILRGSFPQAPSKDFTYVHPISMSHLDSFIEVSQVGHPIKGKLYLHTDKLSLFGEYHDKVSDISDYLKLMAQDVSLNINDAARDQQLPPASLQSFLKAANLSGLVIADHNKMFTNEYYNSRLDRATNVRLDYPPEVNTTEAQYNYMTEGAIHLQKLATALARTLYNRTTGMDPKHINADGKTIANMMYCFLKSPQCDLFRTVLSPSHAKDLSPHPYPFYVSVEPDNVAAWIPHIIRNLMTHFMGNKLDHITNQKDCQALESRNSIYSFVWMQGDNTTRNSNASGMCVKSVAFRTTATSPAFEIDDYDWNSRQYSTWSESIWQEEYVMIRYFLKPSGTKEMIILISGSVWFVFSMILMYLIQKRNHLIFHMTHHQFIPVS